MNTSFLRVAAASFCVKTANPVQNAQKMLPAIKKSEALGVQVLVFPELCLSGACCGDLIGHQTLLASSIESLFSLAQLTAGMNALILVGLPIWIEGCVMSCMAVLQNGRLLALIPKSKILAGAHELPGVPVGNFSLVINGVSAEVIFDGESIDARKLLLSASSAPAVNDSKKRLQTRFASASAVVHACNAGDSVTDSVFDGACAIIENGRLTEYSDGFDGALACCDIDTALLEQPVLNCDGGGHRQESIKVEIPPLTSVKRALSKTPWNIENSDEEYERIVELQGRALAKRADDIGANGFVLGVSGGLDSTVALLACCRAAKILGKDNSFVHGVSLPGFGSSERTKTNGQLLMDILGVSSRVIDIVPACEAHFMSLGRDSSIHDTTFENCQARERTKVLFSISNSENMLCVGTGDLSEIALGFSTYGGDHMSFYSINGSLLKTQMQELVRYYAKTYPETKKVLLDIVKTPISPELLPTVKGEIAQKTESLIGPYDLQDFYLYYLLKYALSPQMLLERALLAFPEYSKSFCRDRLTLLLKRFFANQFKRNCMPEGAAVTELSLSSRVYSMPGDASSVVWLREIE